MPDSDKITPLGKDFGWETNQEAATAGDAVKQMRESEGWKRLMEGVEFHLRREQRQAMAMTPSTSEPQLRHDIGRWRGMDQIPQIAEAIVRAGDTARAEMQEAA